MKFLLVPRMSGPIGIFFTAFCCATSWQLYLPSRFLEFLCNQLLQVAIVASLIRILLLLLSHFPLSVAFGTIEKDDCLVEIFVSQVVIFSMF